MRDLSMFGSRSSVFFRGRLSRDFTFDRDFFIFRLFRFRRYDYREFRLGNFKKVRGGVVLL